MAVEDKSEFLLEVRDLSFEYKAGRRELPVLRHLNFNVRPGEFIAIRGPSGSGKSTLFYILGLLLRPTSGHIFFLGRDIARLSEDEKAVMRNREIGFVFQQFHLLAKSTAKENILLPTVYPIEVAELGDGQSKSEERALLLARTLGIDSHLSHLPNQLSGGQQQRVAIARALMQDVQLILADEPTGNLDSKSSQQILDLLSELHKQGKTIVIITHDPECAKRCERVYTMHDGQIIADEGEARKHEGVHARPRDTKEKIPHELSLVQYQRLMKAALPLAVKNLWRSRGKSFLTMLGVIIGVAAVMSMVTLGQFTKRRILETYEALGVNKLLIRGYPNWNMKATDKTGTNFREFDYEKDLMVLPTVFPEVLRIAPTMESYGLKALAEGKDSGDNPVFPIGISPEYLYITSGALAIGRNISQRDIDERSPVCIVGFDIAKRLFEHLSPLGQIVTLNDQSRTDFPCRVIGVLESVRTNSTRTSPNTQVLLPYTYLQTVMGSWWQRQIHTAAMQVAAGSDVDRVGQGVQAYFKRKYGKSGVFNVDSDSHLVQQMKKFLNIFSWMLAAIAFLSLVVGGVGINNMMLISVAERFREFGIRKALGATHRSVRVQVFIESMALCVTAGLIGLILGFSAYELLIYGAAGVIPNVKFEWVFEPAAAAIAAISIVAVGIGSGLAPAIKAEKLQVIEALRTE